AVGRQLVALRLIVSRSASSLSGVAGFQRALIFPYTTLFRSFAIEYQSSNGQIDRLPAIVADVVACRVTVILAVSDSFALAAKAGTTAIPIVYIGGNDPVRIGLVSSLNSPGGHVTGELGDCNQAPAIAQEADPHCPEYRSIA